uniref:Uncharacterized protein DDB_G0292642 n=1 Tax=Zeugodacus cucurbitae TaxID=28588 RepID=A0A0A1X5M7_ZEUCU
MKIICNILLLLAVGVSRFTMGSAANITILPKECMALENTTVSGICAGHSPYLKGRMQTVTKVFQIETTNTNPYLVGFNTSELPECFAKAWITPFVLDCHKDNKGQAEKINVMKAALYCKAVFGVKHCGQDFSPDLNALVAARFLGFRESHAAPSFVAPTWYTAVCNFFWYFLYNNVHKLDLRF